MTSDMWIALITFVAAPIAASVAANLSLVSAVRKLTIEMKEVKEAIDKIPNHEGRLIRLESLARKGKKL